MCAPNATQGCGNGGTQSCGSACSWSACANEKKANGSICTAASQCLSNQCTDGRCCTATCGACQTCTGAGGTCVLPANIKACSNGTCIAKDDCCSCDLSSRCASNSRVVRGVCINGECGSEDVMTCRANQRCEGSSCVVFCGNEGQPCCTGASSNPCNDGILNCVSGTCSRCSARTGQACNTCGGKYACNGVCDDSNRIHTRTVNIRLTGEDASYPGKNDTVACDPGFRRLGCGTIGGKCAVGGTNDSSNCNCYVWQSSSYPADCVLEISSERIGCDFIP